MFQCPLFRRLFILMMDCLIFFRKYLIDFTSKITWTSSFLCGKVFENKFNFFNRNKGIQVFFWSCTSFGKLCFSKTSFHLSCQIYWHIGIHKITFLMSIGPVMISIPLLFVIKQPLSQGPSLVFFSCRKIRPSNEVYHTLAQVSWFTVNSGLQCIVLSYVYVYLEYLIKFYLQRLKLSLGWKNASNENPDHICLGYPCLE